MALTALARTAKDIVIALLQRVKHAHVEVAGLRIAAIEQGLLALIGVERTDNEASADRLAERIVSYRVFSDDAGKMNRSLRDVNGGLLLVPQFTLAADTSKGLRPSFSPAADPETGHHLFSCLMRQSRAQIARVEAGQFGADMQVSLVNDGPVTFWLQV